MFSKYTRSRRHPFLNSLLSIVAVVTLVSANSNGSGCTHANGVVTCNLGSLNSAATATATVVMTPNQVGTITNTVGVAASESDPNTANNSVTKSAVVTASSLQIVNNYAINQTTGAQIVPGETDIGNHCDDCTTLVTLPFAYTLYDRTFTTATITSNGIIEFTGSTARFSNGCLPDTDPALEYTILGYFDDLRTDAANIPGLGPSGIFTSVTGTAPNRVFNVEWRSTFFNNNAQAINFEIRLFENQPRFDVIYAQIDQFGSSATVGVQRTATTGFTQYECDQGGLTPGLQLSFIGSDQLFLSGLVIDSRGAGIPGVTVNLSGTQTASVVTDASGFYTFNNLTPGGLYTITPTREGFTFTPPNAGFENLRNSQTANFTGTQQQQTGFTISGRVANTLGEGIAGAAVALSGTQTATATTDANGSYSFANLAASGNYTVTPALANFTFTPPSRTFNSLSGNQTADFTGTLTLVTPVGTNVSVEFAGDTINYSQVTAAGVTTANPISPATAGTPPAGYTLLQVPGIDLATTASVSGIITVCFVDTEGAISNELFPNLRLLHGEGGVLVDRTSLVDVASRRICAQVASLSPFVLAIAPARAISGRITDGTNGLSGVTLTVTNDDTGQTLTATTDQNGNYSFTVAAGGDYTVTTTREGVVFDPAFRTFLDLSGNQTGDFVGATAITITGQIPGLPPGQTAIVTLSGTRSDVTTTDTNGNFTFTNLPPGGNYIVTAESSTQTFNPLRFEFMNLGTNVTTANFAPTANPSPTPAPPISDDFGGNVRDPNKFNEGTLTQPPGSTDPLVTVVQQDGKLVITPRTNITDASFNGYVTVRAVDFTGATAMVQVDETADGGAQTIFSIGSNDQNFFRFVAQDPEANLDAAAQSRAVGRLDVRPLTTSLRQLVFQARQGGVLTAMPIPYDPVAMKFWRFRHDTSAAPALMHFETSPTGLEGTYTIRFTRIVPGEIGALATELVAGTAGAVQTPGRAVFDNLLVQPRGIVGGFRFDTPTYTVNEGDGSVTITVMRSGAVAQSGSVTLATAAFDNQPCNRMDGIARPRCDVATTLVRLRFGPGETSKDITLFITDDSYVEGTERIELGLADASGNLGLDDPLATISIIDNDIVTGPNPITTIPFFVRQQYRDFLFREPEPGGFEAWTNLLSQCAFNGDFGPGKSGSDPTCDRITVSSSFYRSPEFLARGYFIYRFYDAALGRLPTYAEFLAEMNRLAGPRTLGQQETDKRDFITEFRQQSEFITRYGAFNTGAAVDRLLQTAGVTLPNRNQLVSDLEAGRRTPAETLRLIIESDAVSQRFFNRGFVTMQYFGYLQRDPDPEGFARWIAVLDQTGDFRVMVFGFLYSPEYLMRFGPVQ